MLIQQETRFDPPWLDFGALALGSLAALRLTPLAFTPPKTQGREDSRRSIPARRTELLQKQIYTGIAYLSVCHTDNLSKQLEDAKKATNEISNLYEKAITDIESKAKEADQILTKAREVAGSESAQAFAKIFQKIADGFETSAKWWLGATAGFAFFTILTAIGSWWYGAVTPADGNILLQRMSSKLVVMATLLTGTFWCGKNYKALRHLAVVNRHREVSIKTLQAFTGAVKIIV